MRIQPSIKSLRIVRNQVHGPSHESCVARMIVFRLSFVARDVTIVPKMNAAQTFDLPILPYPVLSARHSIQQSTHESRPSVKITQWSDSLVSVSALLPYP